MINLLEYVRINYNSNFRDVIIDEFVTPENLLADSQRQDTDISDKKETKSIQNSQLEISKQL
jgi:hypothetical protein